MSITHFQFKETKSKNYFRKAWSFSFVSNGTEYYGIYHQDGNIDWEIDKELEGRIEELTRELHHLMEFHVFR